VSSRRPASTALVAAGLATFAVVATGCSRPTPLVSLYSGKTTVSSTAIGRYCVGDSQTQCTTHTTAVPTLKVATGSSIGIDVPKSVAEQGWVLTDQSGSPLVQKIYKQHYVGLSGISLQGPTVLQVVKLSKDGQTPLGAWRFTLVPS
jgi:hypothetical protein